MPDPTPAPARNAAQQMMRLEEQPMEAEPLWYALLWNTTPESVAEALQKIVGDR